MKTSKKMLGVLGAGALALLGPSVGSASMITVTPSTATPLAGSTFTLTVSADATMPLTTGATLGMTYDVSKVTVASVAFIGPNFNFASTLAGATPGTTDLVSVITTSAAGLTGPFSALTITFNAIAAGAANIVLVDQNGGDLGWSDDQGATIPGVTYTQANVTVGAVPLPASIWLLGTALGFVGVKRRRVANA